MFKRLLWLVGLLLLMGTACTASSRADIRGPATIRFGSALSQDGLSIEDEKTQFALTDTVVLLVDLGAPFPTTGAEMMLSRLESKGEYVIHTEPIVVPPGTGSVMNADLRPWVISLMGPGRYRVQIIKGDTVLAIGEFDLVD